MYSQALLCADYPILCAPIPPTANSPMLSTYPRRPRRGKRLPYHYDVGVPMDTDDMMTSGVPSPEALCEFLRLAFGLTPQKAERYERLVTEQYRKRKKSRDRVLLSCDLCILINIILSYNNFLCPSSLWQMFLLDLLCCCHEMKPRYYEGIFTYDLMVLPMYILLTFHVTYHEIIRPKDDHFRMKNCSFII